MKLNICKVTGISFPTFCKFPFLFILFKNLEERPLKTWSVLFEPTNLFFAHRDRLIANDFIQMHKVAEHVYEKVLGSDSGSVAVSPGMEDQDNGSLAEEKVELLCNEQVRLSCHSS